MNFEEMNQRAYEQESIPDELVSVVDVLFWQMLKMMYAAHSWGAFDRKYGIAMKENLAEEYKIAKDLERDWLRCKTALKILRQHENPDVRAVAAEIDKLDWE